jgi:hypothetical protein
VSDGPRDTRYFSAATADPGLIAELKSELQKAPEARIRHIDGLLAAGTCAHNPGYDWHFIPGEWELAEASIEWCDVFPANPDVTGVDRACPWSSRVHARGVDR